MKMKIGIGYRLPSRKRLAVFIEYENKIEPVAYFTGEATENIFLKAFQLDKKQGLIFEYENSKHENFTLISKSNILKDKPTAGGEGK